MDNHQLPPSPPTKDVVLGCSLLLVMSGLFMWGVKALFSLTDYGKSRTVEDQWVFSLLVLLIVLLLLSLASLINQLKQKYGKQKLRKIRKELVLRTLFAVIVLVIPGIFLLAIFSTPFPLMWILGSVMYVVIIIKVIQSGLLNFSDLEK
ncbi:MAG: hypothetical protein Q4D98_03565 [Planctomycetia bacterium]|nr:hypothetical protein [Planctomycetia bacterium]